MIVVWHQRKSGQLHKSIPHNIFNHIPVDIEHSVFNKIFNKASNVFEVFWRLKMKNQKQKSYIIRVANKNILFIVASAKNMIVFSLCNIDISHIFLYHTCCTLGVQQYSKLNFISLPKNPPQTHGLTSGYRSVNRLVLSERSESKGGYRSIKRNTGI